MFFKVYYERYVGDSTKTPEPRCRTDKDRLFDSKTNLFTVLHQRIENMVAGAPSAAGDQVHMHPLSHACSRLSLVASAHECSRLDVHQVRDCLAFVPALVCSPRSLLLSGPSGLLVSVFRCPAIHIVDAWTGVSVFVDRCLVCGPRLRLLLASNVWHRRCLPRTGSRLHRCLVCGPGLVCGCSCALRSLPVVCGCGLARGCVLATWSASGLRLRSRLASGLWSRLRSRARLSGHLLSLGFAPVFVG